MRIGEPLTTEQLGELLHCSGVEAWVAVGDALYLETTSGDVLLRLSSAVEVCHDGDDLEAVRVALTPRAESYVKRAARDKDGREVKPGDKVKVAGGTYLVEATPLVGEAPMIKVRGIKQPVHERHVELEGTRD